MKPMTNEKTEIYNKIKFNDETTHPKSTNLE